MLLKSSNNLKELRVEISTNCNTSCGYCYLNAQQDQFPASLSSKTYQKYVDAFLDQGLKTVSFTGGEPLLSSKLIDFIYFAVQSGLETGILTNGSLLTPEKADQLYEAGLKWARISVDVPSDNKHAQERLGRYFPNVDNAIELFHERGIPVILRPTATLQNVTIFPALARYAYERRVTRVEVQPYMPCGVEAIDQKYFMDSQTHLEVLGEILRLRRKWQDKLNFQLYSGWFEFLSPEYRGEEIKRSRCGRSFLYLDSTGRLKTCAMSRLYLSNMDTKSHEIKHLLYEHPYLLALQKMTPTGICTDCDWFSICNRSWCPAVNTTFNLPVNAPIPICPKVMLFYNTNSIINEQKEKEYAISI